MACSAPKPAQWYSTTENPLILGKSSDWKSVEDASLQVAAAHTAKELILSFRVTDERILAGKDLLEVAIDARSEKTRRQNTRLRGGIIQLEINAPDMDSKITATATTHLGRGKKNTASVEAAAVRTATGWDVEVALPIEMVNQFQYANQPDGWSSFQMSASYSDVDEPDVEPAIVVWRGSRNVRWRNTNYAQFVRGE